MKPGKLERLHATIEGHVQGVGFRYFVQDHAASSGLTGWVRNTYDGQVELAAEGSRQQLETLLEKVNHGPRSAYVVNVQVEWQEATGSYRQFSVLPTS